MASLVTVKQLIASVFLRLELDDSRDEVVFNEWIWDALREIGPSRLDKKRACMDMHDLCFNLPHDYSSAIDLNLLDSSGAIYSYHYSETGFLESEVNNRSDSRGQNASLSGGYNRLTIVENKRSFSLSSNANDLGITSAELVYYALPMDGDGNILIEEIMQEAVMAFIEYMYIKRERNKDRNKIPMSEVDWHWDKWTKKRQEMRGYKKDPGPLGMDPIARRWITSIPNFRNKRRHTR